MSTTLRELVRNQILAEAPGMEGAPQAERYVERTLHDMSNSELLDRISDALQTAAQMPVRPWL